MKLKNLVNKLSLDYTTVYSPTMEYGKLRNLVRDQSKVLDYEVEFIYNYQNKIAIEVKEKTKC